MNVAYIILGRRFFWIYMLMLNIEKWKRLICRSQWDSFWHYIKYWYGLSHGWSGYRAGYKHGAHSMNEITPPLTSHLAPVYLEGTFWILLRTKMRIAYLTIFLDEPGDRSDTLREQMHAISDCDSVSPKHDFTLLICYNSTANGRRKKLSKSDGNMAVECLHWLKTV